MAYRPHGKARVDPYNPEAFAICDRCGNLFNKVDLHWQHQYSGPRLQNLRLLVCENCLDEPSPFLKTVIIPPDPPPLFDSRPEPYSIDDNSQLTIRPFPGADMFSVVSYVFVDMEHIAALRPSVSCVSSILSELKYQAQLLPTLSCTSTFFGQVNVGTSISPLLSDTSALSITVEFIKALLPTLTDTSDVTATMQHQTYPKLLLCGAVMGESVI